MNSHEVFIHIHQGCFAGTGAIVRLPQCQSSKPDGYGKISQCLSTTKHSKAVTVCIFLGIYCISAYDPGWSLRERLLATNERIPWQLVLCICIIRLLYKFSVLLCQINIFEFEFEFRCYLRSLVARKVWSHRIHRIQSGFTSKMYSEGCVTVISNYHCRSVLIKSYADLLSSASPNTNTNTNTNNG